MQLLIILAWIIGITAFSLFGSWYARRYNKPDALIGLYVAFVFVSNIIAYKIAEFDLGFIKLYAPAAVLVFAVTFLLTDIVNEKFGRKETQKMIFIAFLTQLAITFFIIMSIWLKPAPFWTDQEAFMRILGFAPRIMLASWIAFLISENCDAYIFSWFKKLTQGRHLWARNIFSSIPSMAIDSFIFIFLAFYGIVAVWPLILGQIVLKWLVGVVDIPFMYLNRWIMYKR